MNRINMQTLLLALTIQPSRWLTWLATVELSPTVSLSELHPRHWRKRTIQRLLLVGYGGLPWLVGIVLAMGLTLIGHHPLHTLFAFGVGWVLGVVLGAWVNMAAGMLVAIVAGTILTIIMPVTMSTLDLFTSARFAWLFGAVTSCVLHTTQQLGGTRANTSLQRQVGSVLLGLIASFVVIGATVAILLVVVENGSDGGINRAIIRYVVGGIPAVVLAVGVWWRTRHLLPTCLTALLTLVVVVFLFGTMGYEYDAQPSGWQLTRSFAIIILSLFLMVMVTSYNLTQRFLKPFPAAITAALGSLTVYPALATITDFLPLTDNLIVASGLLLVGLFAPFLYSIVSYPLVTAWNTLQYRLDVSYPRMNGKRGNRLGRNSVFWDDLHRFRLTGLDDHLLHVLETAPKQGAAYLEQISHTEQRWATQNAEVELDARQLERCVSLSEIADLHNTVAAGLLTGPAGAILFRMKQTSNDVAAALAQPTRYNRRLVLQTIAEQLNNLSLELRRSNEPFRERFRPIVDQWHHIVAQEIERLNAAVIAHKEIPNPYIIGVPLTRRQALFVGRTDISRRIEGFLREDDYPPLLLYGQRRMGKTSLLYQLRWMLPSHIAVLVVDLQGPVALAANHASFLATLGRAIRHAALKQQITCPLIDRAALNADPFPQFDSWLDHVEIVMQEQGITTILLALDEFEALDVALDNGTLSADAILGLLRHIIQHRSFIQIMLAGSHTLNEFERWASYLINAQTLHVSTLSYDDTVQLLTRPIPNFPLHFEPDAIERVWQLTQGHPYLTQLTGAELVAYKNDLPAEQRDTVSSIDVERVVPMILQRGRQFFADIERNQIDDDGRNFLHQLAQNKVTPADDMITIALLIARELIIQDEDKITFHNDLIRYWFAN